MDIKVGDKVVCKYVDEVWSHYFNVGFTYETTAVSSLEKITEDKVGSILHIYSNKRKINCYFYDFNFGRNEFYSYFWTKKELRKLKLNKLNENR